MSKITAAITAVGGYVPEYRLTNKELEKIVDTNDEWIRTRTGITERRILKGPQKASSDLAIPAVMQILEKKNLDPLEEKAEGRSGGPRARVPALGEPHPGPSCWRGIGEQRCSFYF